MSWRQTHRTVLSILFPFLISIAIIVPTLFLLTGGVCAETEPNDSFSSAETLGEGSTAGTISSDDADDYYQTTLQGGETLAVELTVGSAEPDPLYLHIYNADRDPVRTQRVLAGSSGRYEHTVSDATAGGWYIRVTGASEFTQYANSYDIEVTIEEQDDAGTGGDAGDTLAVAASIPYGEELTGYLADDDTSDYYAIDILREGEYNISLEVERGHDTSFYLYIYAAQDDIPMHLEKVDPGVRAIYNLPAKHRRTGTYHIGINMVSGSYDEENSYRFAVHESLPEGTDDSIFRQIGSFFLTTLGIIIALVVIYVIVGLVLFSKFSKGRRLKAAGEKERALSMKALIIGVAIVVAFTGVGVWLLGAMEEGEGGLEPYERPAQVNLPPTAVISSEGETLRIDENITLDASRSSDPDGRITNYLWEFGDGLTANNMTVNHSYSRPGSYIVKLTVTDDGGRKSTSLMNLSIAGNNTNVGRQSILLSTLEPAGLDAETIEFEVDPNALYCRVNLTINGRGLVQTSTVEVDFLGAYGEELNSSSYAVSLTDSTSASFQLHHFESYGTYKLELACSEGAVVCQVQIDVFY